MITYKFYFSLLVENTVTDYKSNVFIHTRIKEGIIYLN